MNYKYVLQASFLLMSFCALARSESYLEDRRLFERACLGCHEMDSYLWPRSHKSWELTVANMKNYVNDEYTLNDDDCARITDFLAAYTGENKLIVPQGVVLDKEMIRYEEVPDFNESLPIAEVVEPPNEPIGPAPELTNVATVTEAEITAVVVPGVTAVAPLTTKSRAKIRGRSLKRLWNPGRGALKIARLTGFIAVGCLLGLLASGFSRRRMKLNFRKIHSRLALGLFLALSAHSVIYIFEYGTPNVTWYWFGLIGLAALLVTQAQGVLRKRFRQGLLISHVVGACAGLTLSILHWVVAWL